MRRTPKAVRKTTRIQRAKTRPPTISKDGKRASTRSNGNAQRGRIATTRQNQPEKLAYEKAQVTEELNRLRAELQEAPDPTGDEADSNVYEREKTLGLVAAYELRLDKIDNALRAAEKGEYGICQRCGRPIDPARLKIFPETRYCVSCQGELERQAKRRMP